MKQMINTQPKNNLVAVDKLELDHMDLLKRKVAGAAVVVD